MHGHWRARAHGAMLIAAMLSGIVLTGCCGSSDGQCKTVMTYKGIKAPGAGTSKQKAQEGACWKYCGDHDTTVNAAFEAWKATQGGKNPDKFSSLDSVPQLKTARVACERECQSDAAANKATFTYTSCE